MAKNIVITGAGTGLGRALARRLAADGDRIILLGRTFAKTDAVAQEIGHDAVAIACDVGDPASVKAAFASIATLSPKIDVLINNAAKIDYSTLQDASDEHIVGTINTNLIGNLLCTRAAIALMQKGGHIINVTSVSVEDPYPHHVVYQASKGGVEIMSRHLQNEVRPRGLRVSVVRAGPMMDEDRSMQADPQAVAAFYQACVDRGMDLANLPVSSFDSVTGLFRILVDMPADVHVDTIRFGSRHA